MVGPRELRDPLSAVEDKLAAQRHLVSRAWLRPFALYALRPLRPFGRPKGAGRHALRRTRRGEGGAPEGVQGATPFALYRAPMAAHPKG